VNLLLALHDGQIAARLLIVVAVLVVVALLIASRRHSRREAATVALVEAALSGGDLMRILDWLPAADRSFTLANAARAIAVDAEGDAAGRVALDLATRALTEAGEEGRVRLQVARTYRALDRADLLRSLLTATGDVDPDSRVGLAEMALDAALPEVADRLLARTGTKNVSNLQHVVIRAHALLALNRADEASALLAAGMLELQRRLQADVTGPDLSQPFRVLQQLHEEAVRRSASAEKAIDAMVDARMLDPKAGVNYRLIGQSLLVDSTCPPRRVRVVSQDALRADADAALRADPKSLPGLEDLGLWYLREGEPHGAEATFQRALDVDARCWPALMGLGAALDTHRRSLRALVKDAIVPTLPDLARLVEPWDALTKDEQALISLSVAPLAHLLPRLLEAGGRLHVVSLDGRCTDLPEFADARGVLVEDADDRRTHDAIEGMAVGPVAAARIDTWYALDGDGCTVTHELGHALHAVLDDAWAERVEDLFEQAEDSEYLSTEYGQTSVFEFFATGYERFALRQARPDGPRNEQDEADRLLGLDAFFRELSAAR
jgi:tetratricopeptide (TPR) repeat protein